MMSMDQRMATEFPQPHGYWTTRVHREPCGHVAAGIEMSAFCTQCGAAIEGVNVAIERVGYEEEVSFHSGGWWHLSSEHELDVEQALHGLADFFQAISSDEMRPGQDDEAVPF